MSSRALSVSFLHLKSPHITPACPIYPAPGNMLCSISSRHAMAILPWFFCLLLIYSFSSSSAANQTDSFALLAIKSQLSDPLQVTSSWNDSVPLCLWTGVTCSRQHQRVTGLDLSNRKIGGRLSPFIGNLSFLRSINLDTNNFYGEIPHEVGRLFRLKTLILANNSFSSTIPTNLSQCSNLVTFTAYANNIVGDIPTEISSMLKLVILGVGQNQLTGQLPAFLGNLTALQVLDFRHNSLTGRIPETIGQLRGLTTLNLAENNFYGTIPPSIYNISSLTDFVLTYNSFTGILPSNIGFSLPILELLAIGGNNFSGSLPTSLSNASHLGIFEVNGNHFHGKVSIDFSGLKNILFVFLGENNFGTGTANDLEFLTSLINCSRLEQIGLENNQFGGELPNSIANLSTKMTELVMGRNQISGTIPYGIRKLVKLVALGLEENLLVGSIPPAIGELKNLQALYLHSNSLQGSIPGSLGNLTILTDLQLGYNNFQGTLPSSLGNCQNLLKLVLNSNKLNGTLPCEIFSITTLSLGLDLSNNLFSGPFPSEVSNLKNLVAMDISGNRFSGEIPFAIGSCTSLENLFMMGNYFSGNIPSSTSSLKSIKILDLSFNNLSGQIPKYLENLQFLGLLNLSYNEFEGEVPTKGVFSNVTEVSLVGNKRLCGGVAELHLPLCHSKGSKTSKILLKVVIPVIVAVLILSSVCFIVVINRTRKSAQNSSSMSNLEGQFPMISYVELSKATNEFSSSNIIGEGSYGIVYKGTVGEDSMFVAIKIINLQRKGASKSFMAECEALRNVRHRNLIKIVTVCSSIDFKGDDFKALVYEYMQNGSLEEWLHYNRDYQLDAGNLSLVQRLNIAIDVSSAIEYLHRHCQPPIIHGDLKPSNVLLDQDMVARVGDFGLASFLSDHPASTSLGTQSSSIGIKGTVGYVAPEYGLGNEVSMSGDVFSFGILLIELFTRKRPTDSMFSDGQTLHDFAKTSLPERVTEIVEPSLLLEAETSHNNVKNLSGPGGERIGTIEECLVAALRIGVLCSLESPAERMEMTDVVAKLRAIRDKFLRC